MVELTSAARIRSSIAGLEPKEVGNVSAEEKLYQCPESHWRLRAQGSFWWLRNAPKVTHENLLEYYRNQVIRKFVIAYIVMVFG